MNLHDQIIAAGRRLVDLGLSPGATGNLSIRDGDKVLLTGTGVSLGRLTATDIAEVSLTGEHLGGARASKETPLHLGLYRRGPEHQAIVHLHSPQTVAMSCRSPWSTSNAVPPLTPYFVMRVGQTPLLPYRHPGDAALGEDIATAPGPLRAALLANHGSVVSGTDLDDAVERAAELEEACRIALLTENSPRRELTRLQIRELADRWNSPWTESPVD